MAKDKTKTKPLTNKKFWQFRNVTGDSAELFLYGDIADSSWWDDEVTPKQFADDLNSIGAVQDITVRINSGGGDVFAAQTIGNLLESNPASVTARIDGLCASAATIVACHCNKVTAAADATYMIHSVQMGLFGYANKADLETYIAALNAITENILTMYEKKTGQSRDDIKAWMDATSWWTAADAKDKGFIDELTEEQTVTENRNGLLFVNNIGTGIPMDEVPDFVHTGKAKAAADNVNTDCHKEVKNMAEKTKEPAVITTVDELRSAYPELVAQIESAAAENATKAERDRIKEIEDLTAPGCEDIANDAKFVNPVGSKDYAIAAVKRMKAESGKHLKDAANDADSSGINKVGGGAGGNGANEDEFLNAIKSVNKR